MSSADMERFHAFGDVIGDAGTFGILVGSKNEVSKERAQKMAARYDKVSLLLGPVSGHERYRALVKMACNGEDISWERAVDIFGFQRNLVEYRATC